MNILLDKVSDEVEIKGQKYKINSDFRVGIAFENLLQDHQMNDGEKIIKAVQLYYDEIPEDIEEAVEQILKFFQCGQNEKKQKGSNAVPVYSYEYDQYMIYTAFLFYYHIDLNEIEYLHWWKFKQLFMNLPNESEMKKAMMYRSMKLSNVTNKEQRKYYAQMKQLYHLPDKRNKEEKVKSFANILASGMTIQKEG